MFVLFNLTELMDTKPLLINTPLLISFQSINLRENYGNVFTGWGCVLVKCLQYKGTSGTISSGSLHKPHSLKQYCIYAGAFVSYPVPYSTDVTEIKLQLQYNILN